MECSWCTVFRLLKSIRKKMWKFPQRGKAYSSHKCVQLKCDRLMTFLAKTLWRVTFHPYFTAAVPQKVKARLKLLLCWPSCCSGCTETPCTSFLIGCNDSFLARVKEVGAWGVVSPCIWKMPQTACLQMLNFTCHLEVSAVPRDTLEDVPWFLCCRPVAQNTLFCFVMRCDCTVRSTERG